MSLSTAIKSLVCKRSIATAVVLVLTTCGASAMHASPITYNLELTAFSNPAYSGTGSITLGSAPNATGLSNYASGQYSDLSLNIDGQTFTPPAANIGAVRFLNGSIYDILFAEQIGSSPDRFALLGLMGGYVYSYNNLHSIAVGTITSSIAPSPVPEPSSLLLLGTGALAGLGVMRRRLRI
ncbi:MAG: PEP-CTERM sorting domain-containing protein [Bryocella sp.]